MYQTTLYYGEIEFEGYGDTDSSSVINAVLEFINAGYDSFISFRAFIIVKNKTVLSNKDINELKKFLAIKTYIMQVNNNPIIDFNLDYEIAIAFYNDVLYICTEGRIVERTEKDANVIEDIKYNYIELPYEMPLPMWAVRYLYNNSIDDDFKNQLIENSELKIFN